MQLINFLKPHAPRRTNPNVEGSIKLETISGFDIRLSFGAFVRMTSIKRTLSIPLISLLCFIFISVADSYSLSAFSNVVSRKSIVGKTANMVKLRSHDTSSLRIRRDSFVLRNSMKSSQVGSDQKVSIKKFTKEILQKYLAFCTVFLASILAAPRKALAAAAPLMKNIKVR